MVHNLFTSLVVHRNPPQSTASFFARSLDKVLREHDDHRRVVVREIESVALRGVPGSSGRVLRILPTGLQARRARNRDLPEVLSLPPVRSRSTPVNDRPRSYVPEPRGAQTAGQDDVAAAVTTRRASSARFGLGRPAKVTPRAAGDLRKNEHLAVGRDRLEESVLVDLAVDGHGDTFLEVRPDRGMQLGELLEQVLHGRRRDPELGDAPRELYEVADQDDPRHPSYRAVAPRSFSALSTLGGDIGSSVKRMPVAFSIALAMAPSGGTIGVSPTPRTP